MHKLLNKSLRVLIRTDFLALVATAMLLLYYAAFVEQLGGGSLLDAGFGAGVFALCAAIASLFAGIRADKVKHKARLVSLGYCALGAGFLALAFVQNVWQLLAVYAFIGLVSASYQPAFDPLYTENIGTTRKASSR